MTQVCYPLLGLIFANLAHVCTRSSPQLLLQTKENEELADMSSPLFSMYQKMTEEEDKEMAKR